MFKISTVNMYADKLSGYGLTRSEVGSEIKSAISKEEFLILSKSWGFTRLPEQADYVGQMIDKFKEQLRGMNTIVVVGIGGPGLSTKVIHSAINGHYHNERLSNTRDRKQYKVYFAGDTTDPEYLAELIDVIELRKTMFVIISKSGTTIEQASNFLLFREKVIGEVGLDDHFSHFCFITDAESGSLAGLAAEQNYTAFEFPADVGGRFSILSIVGLLVNGVNELNWRGVLAGAKAISTDLDQSNSTIWDKLIELAVLQKKYVEMGHSQSVMTVYPSRLADFAMWYRQIWAESLGKKENRAGEKIDLGMTPIAGIGPSDQHSQLQLYNDGPNDKVHLFLRARSGTNLQMPDNYKYLKDYEYFKGHNFRNILNQEQSTTAFALAKNSRPNLTIEINSVSENELGQLLYFFQLLTALTGELLDIDAFDQPGVELSKNAMYGVLGKPGYEMQLKEFEEFAQK